MKSLIFSTIVFMSSQLYASTIIFLDNSVSKDTYIPSNKEAQIKAMFNLAIEDLKQSHPSCHLHGKVMVGRSNLLNIIEQKKEISSTSPAEDTVLVGLIHSSEALLAAKAFTGTDYLAISSGATTDSLGISNPNFFSLANSMKRFSSVVSAFLKNEIKVKKVVAVVPGDSFYSQQFADALSKELDSAITYKIVSIDPLQTAVNLAKIKAETTDADAVFTPGFIQEALPILNSLMEAGFKKPIVGSPNWGRSRADLETFAKAIGLKNEAVYFPVSWIEGESSASKLLEARFKKSHHAVLMGTALYTYDATRVAGSYLCESKKTSLASLKTYLEKRINTSGQVRSYGQIQGNSLSSKITMVRLNKDQKSFIPQKVYP